jgi:hypothetical protein
VAELHPDLSDLLVAIRAGVDLDVVRRRRASLCRQIGGIMVRWRYADASDAEPGGRRQ